MSPHRTIDRTRTDEERIEHLAEADGNGERAVELDVAVRPWLAGSVVSAVQTQILDGRSPAEAMERGVVDGGRQNPGAEQDERDPE